MGGKQLFLLMIFTISFSNAELQNQTLFLNDEDAGLALHENLYQTAASDPNPKLRPNTLSMEMVRRDHMFAAVNEKMSLAEIIKNRLQRDQARAASISRHATRPSPTANGTVISGASMGIGEYLTRLGIGSPPQLFDMILDTGSDLTWLQCDPCKKCYQQIDPIFKPKSSKTYQLLSCNSKPCKLLYSHRCSKTKNKCQYGMGYGDGSLTFGDLSTETLTLGNSSLPGIPIGCGYDNEGLFVAAAGILGLGGGKLSFPNQASVYGRRFSYCLVSRGSNDTSSITFGETAVPKKTRYTPMITNNASGMDTFYYVNLTGMSVGGTRVRGLTSAISKIYDNGDGGVIVDSGTTITHLEESAYFAVRDAFHNATDKLNLTRAPPPDYLIGSIDTCYNFSGLTTVSVPTVVLRFDGGARMALPANNYLLSIDGNGLFCFAFAPMKGMSIIGNTQQQGFRVTYDLKGKRIGFASRSC